MCVVSMISDWGRDRWPLQPQPYSYPSGPLPLPPSPYLPSKQEWDEFKELLRRAAEYDKRTNQPDCEDPKKQEWMKEIERRLELLERGKEG